MSTSPNRVSDQEYKRIEDKNRETFKKIVEIGQSDNYDERVKAHHYYFWKDVLNGRYKAQDSANRPIYFIEMIDFDIISSGYYEQFKPYPIVEYSKGRGNVYPNEALRVLGDPVKDLLGNVGKRFVDTVESVYRYNEVYKGSPENSNEVLLFHSIDEGYFNSIINYDPDKMPVHLVKQADKNAQVARQALERLKESATRLEENQEYYDQYWSPRFSEFLDEEITAEELAKEKM